LDEQDDDSLSTTFEADCQLHVLLSQEAMSVTGSSNALMFQGTLQGHSIIILVDSGISNSFINEKFSSIL
jgi:hypothetical protein